MALIRPSADYDNVVVKLLSWNGWSTDGAGMCEKNYLMKMVDGHVFTGSLEH